MNKKFFIHQITIYHLKDEENVTKTHLESVYFRYNKKVDVVDKRPSKRKYGLNNNTY